MRIFKFANLYCEYLYRQLSPQIYTLLRKKINAHAFPSAQLKQVMGDFPTTKAEFHDWIHLEPSSKSSIFKMHPYKRGVLSATFRLFLKYIYFLANILPFPAAPISKANTISFVYSLHKNQIWHSNSLIDLYE